MAKILIAYSTTDGHTLEICQRLQRLIEQQGHQVTLASVDSAPDMQLGSAPCLALHWEAIPFGAPRVVRPSERPVA